MYLQLFTSIADQLAPEFLVRPLVEMVVQVTLPGHSLQEEGIIIHPHICSRLLILEIRTTEDKKEILTLHP